MIGLACLISTRGSSAGSLLVKSHIWADTHGWYLGGPHYDIAPQWTKSGSMVFGRMYGDVMFPHFRICVKRLKSGRERSYTAIMATADSTRGMMLNVLPCPNGSDVLWWTRGRIFTGKIRGSKAHKVLDADTEACSDPVWLPDCKHFAVVYAAQDRDSSSTTEVVVTIGSIDWHKRPRSLRVHVENQGDHTYYKLSVGTSARLTLVQVWGAEGDLNARAIAAMRYSARSGIHVQADSRLNKTLKHIHTDYIVPLGANFAYISHDKHIGNNGRKGRKGSMLSLWISSFSSARRHTVGSVFAKEHDGYETSIRCLAWLPDRMRMSYIFRNKLYTVKAQQCSMRIDHLIHIHMGPIARKNNAMLANLSSTIMRINHYITQ